MEQLNKNKQENQKLKEMVFNRSPRTTPTDSLESFNKTCAKVQGSSDTTDIKDSFSDEIIAINEALGSETEDKCMVHLDNIERRLVKLAKKEKKDVPVRRIVCPIATYRAHLKRVIEYSFRK